MIDKIDMSQALCFSTFSTSGRINGEKILLFGILTCDRWPY